MISRTHAKIQAAPDNTFTLTDLNSTNGVFVNNRRINSHILREGDVIIFGGALPTTKLGDILFQPNSEFVYRFEHDSSKRELVPSDSKQDLSPPLSQSHSQSQLQSASDSESKSAFDSMKVLTENITVIFTWISSLVIAGSYLFAEEESQEFSYIRNYVKPIFDTMSIPFTRATLITTILILATMSFLIFHFASRKR